MGKTDTFEREVLKLSLGLPTTLTYPITPFLALFTTMPAEDGTGGVEVSGGGYSRKSLAGKFPTPTGAGSVTNNAEIDFGTAGSNWGQVVGGGVYTAASGGTLVRFAASTPVTISNGQPVTIPVGSFTIEEN